MKKGRNDLNRPGLAAGERVLSYHIKRLSAGLHDAIVKLGNLASRHVRLRLERDDLAIVEILSVTVRDIFLLDGASDELLASFEEVSVGFAFAVDVVEPALAEARKAFEA